MLVCSVSGDDEQCEPGDEIEDHPQYLVERNKRVEHRVDRFPRDIEELVVDWERPVAGTDTNQRRAAQYYPVNNGAPHKKCFEDNDIHIVSPFSYVLLI